MRYKIKKFFFSLFFFASTIYASPKEKFIAIKEFYIQHTQVFDPTNPIEKWNSKTRRAKTLEDLSNLLKEALFSYKFNVFRQKKLDSIVSQSNEGSSFIQRYWAIQCLKYLDKNSFIDSTPWKDFFSSLKLQNEDVIDYLEKAICFLNECDQWGCYSPEYKTLYREFAKRKGDLNKNNCSIKDFYELTALHQSCIDTYKSFIDSGESLKQNFEDYTKKNSIFEPLIKHMDISILLRDPFDYRYIGEEMSEEKFLLFKQSLERMSLFPTADELVVLFNGLREFYDSFCQKVKERNNGSPEVFEDSYDKKAHSLITLFKPYFKNYIQGLESLRQWAPRIEEASNFFLFCGKDISKLQDFANNISSNELYLCVNDVKCSIANTAEVSKVFAGGPFFKFSYWQESDLCEKTLHINFDYLTKDTLQDPFFAFRPQKTEEESANFIKDHQNDREQVKDYWAKIRHLSLIDTSESSSKECIKEQDLSSITTLYSIEKDISFVKELIPLCPHLTYVRVNASRLSSEQVKELIQTGWEHGFTLRFDELEKDLSQELQKDVMNKLCVFFEDE